MGGISVVSTANNHALDYGLRGLRETMENLDSAGVAFSGTAMSESLLVAPVLIEKHGVRISLFSCTDMMNIEEESWKRSVTPADTALLLPRIREAGRYSDFIVVSYHGGAEYADAPSARTIRFARKVLDGGADLFLGHHPHVPQKIEYYKGKVIVYSLGNFVFRQPFDYWTQRSFAFAATITKREGKALITRTRVLPLIAGDQPKFLVASEESARILERIGEFTHRREKEVAWAR
jgi:poly-gamma-glutamate synthesis protein (capsule biosynthesis protein)